MIYENIPLDLCRNDVKSSLHKFTAGYFFVEKSPYQVENSSHNPSISDTLLLSVIYCKGR